jgi:DNA-binding SARP family transcriptional activator
LAQTKVQLCGKLVVELDGQRVEERLPGRQGRVLFAYLAANRSRTVAREALVRAMWPSGHDGGLAPLLSKLRRIVPLEGHQLRLPAGAWVDLEAAGDAVHRAESALAKGDVREACPPAQVALAISRRPFLPGVDLDWVDEVRRRLADYELRALETYGHASLVIGGAELPAAIRSGRELIRLQPYRESGYRILMEGLALQGNAAEALRVYDDLRRLLHEELGAAPSPATQELHRQLLG